MSLLLVVVLLFFSSSCSVSSGQYYVSDDCSSVTHNPCNPLSVYAGNMSQYNDTIFYFIGTSSIYNYLTMDLVQNVTLHGLDKSPVINCRNKYAKYDVRIYSSSYVTFSNISWHQCYMSFEFSRNVTVTNSLFKIRPPYNKQVRFMSRNMFDCQIVSSVFDNVDVQLVYDPPFVYHTELSNYSLTLTNVTLTAQPLILNLYHGTSYNLSVTFADVNVTNTLDNVGITVSVYHSYFYLYITNSSVSNSSSTGFYLDIATNVPSKNSPVEGVRSRSTVVIEGCKFYNNSKGLHIIGRYSGLTHHHHIIIRSCSIYNNAIEGLQIDGSLSTSTRIIVMNTKLIGNVRNEITKCLSILLSNVTVTKSLSTGLVLQDSVVSVENKLALMNNTGVVGGGIALNDSSVIILLPSAYLKFIDNHASYKGGGLYFDPKTECQFKQKYGSMQSVPLTLKNNTAGIAGNDIYGHVLYKFKLTNHKISSSSDAATIKFCHHNSNESTPYYDANEQHVFPGQVLKYEVALFGFNYAKSYSPTDGTVKILINEKVMKYTYVTSNCSLVEYKPKRLKYTRHKVRLIVDTLLLSNKPTYIESNFILYECPIGFSMDDSQATCTCSQSVSRENVTCDINTLNITHNGLLWIGMYDTSTPFHANETNPNACIINEDCLLYCSPNPVTFQLNDTDTQCVDNRGQRMCGSCRKEYSLLMGSNKCGQCHNNYVVIAWIALFAVMGVLLVVLLIALNLTVSVGTLNGLLFYANIVKLFEPVFSRKGALPVLNQVISWINLDFGFEICFYNGMDSYSKQWLQFAFPLYLWIIIIIIIQLCRKYGKISRLMGSNTVPVLSTLTFLSYTKLVRTIVIVLHKRQVTLHCTNESVKSVSLWYEDPNVEYAKGKHAGLFGFALLVSVLFVIPYTLFLLFHPVLEKYLSHFKLFRSWSRFKPIIDAYSGPMKDEYRFWPGLLLIARIPIILNVTFLKNESRVLLLAVAAIILSLSFAFGGAYRKKSNSIIEFWFLLNLCIIASLSVAFTDESKVLIWYNTCLSVFLFSFSLIVVYHLYLQLSNMKCYDALIKKLCKKQDEDDEPLLDVTESHLTVDEQRRAIVPSSTDVRRCASCESVVNLF